MSVACKACGAEGPDGMRFCGQCGTPLNAARPATTLAEMRVLTVLFCDLVASTQLAELLDPEDLREVMREYHDVCTQVIRRFEGHVAQYLGDGLLVYFGYPVAHEDDARRAVRAGLGIVEAMARLDARLSAERGVELRVRVGVHTGLVVVGDVGDSTRHERLALGKTPNVAARVQQAAVPGAVVVSDATFRLVRGFFAWEELGATEVKGVAEPLMLHRALAESGAESRLDVARTTGLTPFVGRDEELARLDTLWTSVVAGRGHAVLVRGEAGIGKSRLTGVLKDRRRAESSTVLECFCSPYFENSELYPIIGMIERELGFASDSDPAEKLVVLAARLARRQVDAEDALPLMASLLAIPTDADAALVSMTPQRKRQRTLETLVAWLFAIPADRPAVLLVEDLHWADPTTLEFLGLVLEHGSSVRLLSVLTARPEFEPPWPAGEHLSRLTLNRLTAAETSAMTARVARNKRLPPEVLQQLVARTEGVPLYVEEVTKAVLESGGLTERADRYELAGAMPADLIPDTVQGSLTARLDRLGASKPVAQLAATMGREFSYDVLAAVAQLDDTVLRRHLDRLVETELVFQRGEPPDATYLFKHALIQDAAYQSLLRKTRQELHRRIAETLVERFPQVAEAQPALLAQHYAGAALLTEAVHHWTVAGQRALGRAANIEAIAHLQRGLEALASTPASAERAGRELLIQVALGPALMAIRGYATPEVHAAYSRAWALCAEVGDTPQLFPVLWGLWAFYFVGGRLREALPLAEQVLRMAQAAGDPDLLPAAYHAIGFTRCYRAEYRETLAHTEAGIAVYERERELRHVARFQLSSTVPLYHFSGTALWMLGFPDQARERDRASHRLARELGHAPSQAFAGAGSTWFYQAGGEPREIEAAVAAVVALSVEEEFSFWPPLVRAFHAWAVAEAGDVPAALRQARESWAQYRAIGGGILTTHIQALIAELEMRSGEPEAALATIAAALEGIGATEEHHYEPELHRLRAEALLWRAPDDPAAVEPAEWSFDAALQLARRQEARWLELRAARRWAHHLRRWGRAAEARALLAPVVASFTEGFDTADLSAARALLDTLPAGPAPAGPDPATAAAPDQAVRSPTPI